jgi:hypothetical protein
MDFSEIGRFVRNLECAFESQIGADDIVETLIYVAKGNVGFQVVIIEVAEVLPRILGSTKAFDPQQSAANDTEAGRFPREAARFESKES